MENDKNKGISGVYALVNKQDKIVYIGSSININRRFSEHKNFAKNTERKNRVYDYIRKYGDTYFTLQILETTDSTENSVLEAMEQKWIENFDKDYSRINTNKPARAFNRTNISKSMMGVNKGIIHNKLKHRLSCGLKVYCVELDKKFNSLVDFVTYINPEIDTKDSKYLKLRNRVSNALTCQLRKSIVVYDYTLQRA